MPQHPDKRFLLGTLALGLLLLPAGVLVISLFPSAGHDLSPGFGGPVYAFEFARTPHDLDTIFGPEGDVLRGDRKDRMMRGTHWDFPFLVLYSAFMASFALASFSSSQNRLVTVAMVGFALSAGVFDAIENFLLLKILWVEDPSQFLKYSIFPVYGKFLSIASVLVLVGVVLFPLGRVEKVLALMCLTASLCVFAGLGSPSQLGFMLGGAISTGWFAMLVFVILQLWRIAVSRNEGIHEQ